MPNRKLNKHFLVTHDTDVDAAYIYLRPIASGGVAQTIPVNVPLGAVNLDLDPDGRLIGIEILLASAVLPETVVS